MGSEKPKDKNLEPAGKASGYDETLAAFVRLLESSRHSAARAVNAVMTATYREIGRRIVEIEQ